MEDWNDNINNLSEVLGSYAKYAREIKSKVIDELNNFAKSEEFQRLVELFSSIPDDVQKTVFLRNAKVWLKMI